MTHPQELPLASLQFYATAPYPCSYLPDRQARSQVATPSHLINADTYSGLVASGFRRSGMFTYRPYCDGCRACVPLRVPVATFVPSRSQRRVLRRNADVEVVARKPAFDDTTWQLYDRYLRFQHAPRDEPETPDGLRRSLYAEVVGCVELCYRLGERTIAISLLDVSARSVSSVYHFFDPEFAQRSLGVFSVLHEIAWTRARGASHYHLGYWIEGAATMRYKADYRPHEVLRDGVWVKAS